MEKRHRIFIAINLPQDIKRVLAKYQEKFPEIPAKWVDKENLHITLEFLGNLTDVEIADVCKITGEVIKKHNSFSVDLKKVAFGPPSKMPPKMVWVEGEKSNEMLSLKKDLQKNFLEAVRFRPDGKNFSPHITLARIKEWEFKKIDSEEIPEINEDINLMFTVESVEVMESELKRAGPQYTILESFELCN